MMINILKNFIRGRKTFGESIDGKDFAAGLATIGVSIGGYIMAVHYIVKGRMQVDKKWMDFVSNYASYKKCDSSEASQKHFSDSIILLENEKKGLKT